MSRRKRRKGKGTVYLSPRPVSYGTANLGHVVLLGDSILDCEHYTGGKPDVAQRLHSILGEDWRVTLIARDGATTGSLGWQVKDIPPDATHLILSIGGNDAMGEQKILDDPELRTMRDALDDLSFMAELFAMSYADAVTPLVETGIPLTICTIYSCDFPEDVKYPVQAALALFNDVIIRFALAHHIPILDLRNVCTEPEDFTMQIEPSAIGGAKIAAAIVRCLE
jgi:hypothetical protein